MIAQTIGPIAASRRLAGGASFSPDDLASLQVWLDANVGVEEGAGDPAEAGDTVTAWLDQSGNGNNPSVSSTVFQTSPNRLVTTAAGTGNVRHLTNPVQSSPVTIYIVMRNTSDSQFILVSDAPSDVAGAADSSATLSADNNAGSPTYWVNGVQLTPPVKRIAVRDAIFNQGIVIASMEELDLSVFGSLYYIGSVINSIYYSSGDIFEILVFNADVSANRADIVSYLATKWGITLP